MTGRLRAHAEPKWLSSAISLIFYEHLPNGNTSYIADFIMNTAQPGEVIPQNDGMTLPLETAQELMDNLWQCGLRPSEGSGSAGAMKATQEHLKDLQEFSKRLLTMVEGKDGR